jgi:hypothetical protein
MIPRNRHVEISEAEEKQALKSAHTNETKSVIENNNEVKKAVFEKIEEKTEIKEGTVSFKANELDNLIAEKIKNDNDKKELAKKKTPKENIQRKKRATLNCEFTLRGRLKVVCAMSVPPTTIEDKLDALLIKFLEKEEPKLGIKHEPTV